MCQDGYAEKREKELQALLDMVLEMGENTEGACLVMTLVESEATYEVVHALIKYITVLRYKVMRRAGDHTLGMEEIEIQVSKEVVARAAKRLKRVMQRYENPAMRN